MMQHELTSLISLIILAPRDTGTDNNYNSPSQTAPLSLSGCYYSNQKPSCLHASAIRAMAHTSFIFKQAAVQ